MNKKELIAKIAEEQDLPKTKITPIVDNVFSIITDELSKGEKVSIFQFGDFKVAERKATKGVNPRTKEKIDIPAMYVPKFKFAKAVKDKVKNISIK